MGEEELELREVSRGWYFPVCLTRLYEKRTLNAEEMMLLGKINSLCHYKKGCWATNTYLANWWGKKPNWVSITISKFSRMGLIVTSTRRIPTGTERVIRVTFQGDDLSNTTEKSQRGVLEKSQRGVLEKSHRVHDTSYHDKELVGGADAPHASFGLNGDRNPHKTPSMALCQQFHDFIISKHLQVGRKRPNLKVWNESCQGLVDSLDGDHQKVEEVMTWYFEHFKDPWLPTCQAMTTFCESYFKIEKAMFRDRKVNPRKPKERRVWHRTDTGKMVQVWEEIEEKKPSPMPKRVRHQTDTGKMVWVDDYHIPGENREE